MSDAQDSIRVFFGYFEPHTVIAHAQTQIAAAFELLDVTMTAVCVAGERTQDFERLLASYCVREVVPWRGQSR